MDGSGTVVMPVARSSSSPRPVSSSITRPGPNETLRPAERSNCASTRPGNPLMRSKRSLPPRKLAPCEASSTSNSPAFTPPSSSVSVPDYWMYSPSMEKVPGEEPGWVPMRSHAPLPRSRRARPSQGWLPPRVVPLIIRKSEPTFA